MTSARARASFAADLATASGDEVGDVIAFGAERRWFAEIMVAIKTEPSLAAAAFPTLPPRRKAALCRWAATPAATSDVAVGIAVAAAASGAGAAHMAARIVAAHPEIAVHADLIDVLSEQVRAGDTSGAIACCKAGVSPFPFAAIDPTYLPVGYVDDHKAWISNLLADHHPSPAARRRRLLLIPQAAAEAGVMSVAGGRDHYRGTPPNSLHRAATAPHMGGLQPDHEPLTWLATEAIHAGAAMRDKWFAAALRKTAAAHAGITKHLAVLAALATDAPTQPT